MSSKTSHRRKARRQEAKLTRSVAELSAAMQARNAEMLAAHDERMQK
jgi:hypothetical protein